MMDMYSSPLLQSQGQGFDPNNPLAQNNLTGAQNIAGQAATSATPGGGMSQQQKMMLAQALMQMGRQPAPQMPQLTMRGNLPMGM
jgi:hypothetical protein